MPTSPDPQEAPGPESPRGDSLRGGEPGSLKFRPWRTRRPRTGRPFRTYLLTLVVVAVLPAFAVAGIAVWLNAVSHREASAARLLDTAHTLAQAVQSELENHATLLRTLAAALVIDRSNGAQLPALLKDAGLGERSQVLVETIELGPAAAQRPAFTALSVPRDVAEEAVRKLAPALSDLYWPPDADGPRVAMVMAQGMPSALPRMLSLVLPPQQLVRSARPDPAAEATLLVAVTDGAGRLVARSRDADRFVGKLVPDWPKLKAMGTSEGLFEATTAEGGQVMFAFHGIQGTPGWVLVVGEPLAAFNARWTTPLRQLLAGGVAVLVAALLLAGELARRIVVPVQGLARRAHRVAAGQVGAPDAVAAAAPLAIREFESLREALRASEDYLLRSAELERRNAALAETSARRYRTLAEAGASTIWRAGADRRMLAAAGWENLTGRREDEALGFGWLDAMHPDDRCVIDQAARADPETKGRIDLEFRIRARDGEWRWVRSRGATVRDEAGQVAEWIGVIEDIDAQRRAQARIAHLALHDALTGLPNRAQFWQRLQDAIARAGRGEGAALLYIDLDRFKQVNDSLGHPVGDALLQAVTQRLQALVRDTDTVARLGGDEFAIVQSQVREPAHAGDLARRVVSALCEPFDLLGHDIRIGASVGIALVHAGAAPDLLVQMAYSALYACKQRGRGQHAFASQDGMLSPS